MNQNVWMDPFIVSWFWIGENQCGKRHHCLTDNCTSNRKLNFVFKNIYNIYTFELLLFKHVD